MCVECYVDEKRITPLLNPIECLQNHMQYICGTCGRCICIEKEPKRGLQRWNFPFKSLEIAKMYLRNDLQLYLKKNKGKFCKCMKPIFAVTEYKEYTNTQIRKLTSNEVQQYMSER